MRSSKDNKDKDIWDGFDDEDWSTNSTTDATKETSTSEKTKWENFSEDNWAPDFSAADTIKSPEVLQAEEDMRQEAVNGLWISGPGNQAILMAAKREHRLDKGKVFNGFVLEQKSLDDSEFVRFLNDLKEVASQIPEGTRIELAVVTRFIDPQYEWSADYEEGIRTCVHWTAIDLMVGKNGHIHSFVLDAANSFGYQRMHDTLKTMFPEGQHFVYKKEELSSGTQTRVSPIQTQERGCRVFTVEHLKQLSQIDADTLYNKELPQIANSEGVIHASNFSGHLKLTRIFRGMQTWTGLRALPEDMRNTIVKEKTGETLIQYAEKHSTEQGGIRAVKINETMAQKSRHYIEKKREFYQTLSLENQKIIIEDRQGFNYLHHPQLFKLSAMLANIDTRNDTQGVMDFLDKLSKNLEQHIGHSSEDMQHCLDELAAISPFKKGGAIKHEILLAISAVYHRLEESHQQECQHELSKIIDSLYYPRNPRVLFRSIFSEQSESDDDNSSSNQNSNRSSPGKV